MALCFMFVILVVASTDQDATESQTVRKILWEKLERPYTVQQIGMDGKVDPVGSCPEGGRDTCETKFGRHGGCNSDQAKVFAQECELNAKTPLEKQGCQTEKENGINKSDADKWCHTKWASCWAVCR